MSISARNWAWDMTRVTLPDGRARKIKPGEKLVLLCLAEHENIAEGVAFPAQARIAERTGLSVRSVQVHLKSLEQLGHITASARRGSKQQFKSHEYELHVPHTFREDDPTWESVHG